MSKGNQVSKGQNDLFDYPEVPVVSKAANAVEEISVGKDVIERDEAIREKEVKVENLGIADQTRSTQVANPDTADNAPYSRK